VTTLGPGQVIGIVSPLLQHQKQTVQRLADVVFIHIELHYQRVLKVTSLRYPIFISG